MARPISPDITRLLVSWSNGDSNALEQLIPLVSGELRRLAHAYMRRQEPGHLLQTTALVHEAYMRLVDAKTLNWQSRSPLLRHLCQAHARDTGRVCPCLACSEAGRRCHPASAGRGGDGCQNARRRSACFG